MNVECRKPCFKFILKIIDKIKNLFSKLNPYKIFYFKNQENPEENIWLANDKELFK